MINCPCCGKPMGPVEVPLDIPMSPVSRTILRTLPATIEQLAVAVYADRINSPEGEYASIRSTLCRMRKILKPHGWTIDNRQTGGWGQKTYHLVRLP